MINNKNYFMEELGLDLSAFQPRPEAIVYKSQQDSEKALLAFIEREFALLDDVKEKVSVCLPVCLFENRLNGKDLLVISGK